MAGAHCRSHNQRLSELRGTPPRYCQPRLFDEIPATATRLCVRAVVEGVWVRKGGGSPHEADFR